MGIKLKSSSADLILLAIFPIIGIVFALQFLFNIFGEFIDPQPPMITRYIVAGVFFFGNFFAFVYFGLKSIAQISIDGNKLTLKHFRYKETFDIEKLSEIELNFKTGVESVWDAMTEIEGEPSLKILPQSGKPMKISTGKIGKSQVEEFIKEFTNQLGRDPIVDEREKNNIRVLWR